MNTVPGRGRGMQRTARPAGSLAHVDGDVSDMMPTASSRGGTGTSQYAAGLQFHNTFGQNSAPSLPSGISSTSASGQRSPKRRRSPTKAVRTPADLHMAEIPVLSFNFTSLTQVPTSVHSLVQAMKHIHQGHETIPTAVTDLVATSVGPLDPEVADSWLVDPAKYPVRDEVLVLAELRQLEKIAATSKECRQDGAHEVVWNEEVHSRLLTAALEPFHGRLRHRNVTAVDILPEFLPGVYSTPAATLPEVASSTISVAASQPATTLQTKRVDYVIDDEDVRTASMDLLRRQLGTRSAAESINHVVDNSFLRYRPIAISIETKTPEGGELQGRTQLGIWAAAHAMRLRAAVRGGGGDGDGNDDSQAELALPLVLVVGSRWTVHFLVDKGNTLHIYEVPTTEDSTTVVGCYRVLALIRELGRWSTDVYRPWFTQAVLGTSEG